VSSESPGAVQVPVALFVYSRPRQLERTLECLRDGGVRELHVFSDGAKGEADAEGVAEVRRLLSGIDWTEPTVIERGENMGLSSSIRDGLDRLFQTHASAIVIEDDICVAPEFYEYASLALRRYEGERAVAGVTGMRCPFSRRAFDGYPYDVFMSPRFSSWAWATWRDRWREFDFDKSSLRRQIGAAAGFRPELAGADLPGMIHDAVVTESLKGSWDVVCAANMLLQGELFVTPAWNMVENTGLSEGTHASEDPPWQLRWEPEHRPEPGAIRFAPPEQDEQVLQGYLQCFEHTAEGGSAIARARGSAARWRSRHRVRRAWGRL